MSWNVDAKQWLEDFTSVARQSPQSESFDEVDDRVRRALGDDPAAPPSPPASRPQSGPQPALVIPAMVATGAGTTNTGTAGGNIPRLTTRGREPSGGNPAPPKIPPMTRAAAQKKAKSGELRSSSASASQSGVISGELGGSEPSASQSGVLSGEIGGPKVRVRASDSISGEIGAISEPAPRKPSGPKASSSVIIPSLTRHDDEPEKPTPVEAAPTPIVPAPSEPRPAAKSPTFIDSIFDEDEDEDEDEGSESEADVDSDDVHIEQPDDGEDVPTTTAPRPPSTPPVELAPVLDDDDEPESLDSEASGETLLLESVDTEDVDASEVSGSILIEPSVEIEEAKPPPPAAPPSPPPRAKAPKTAPPAPPKRPKSPPPPARAKAPPPQRPKRAEPKPPRKPWYEEAFTEHYAAIEPLDHDISAEIDVEFMIESARLSPQMSVLDVACGNGHHLCMLRKRGFTDLHGVDMSLTQVLRASQKAEKVGGGINLFQGDMRALPTDRTYDAVLCLGTSFGYFDDEVNRQVLVGLREQLAPGGRLVLQVMNGAYCTNILPCRSWWQGRACLVLDVADMNPFQSRMQVHRTVVFEDGRQFEYRMSIRAYSLHELGRMISAAGLKIVELSGSRNTRGRFYSVSSPNIWIVAERRGE